jgi:hypothetical protein
MHRKDIMSARIKVSVNPKRARLKGTNRLAYAAGLFDGEGCVHIARQRKPTSRRGYIFRLNVTVAQNHLDTLVDFQSLTGIEGRIYQRRRQGSSNRDGYALHYDGDTAAELLEALHPYLRRKADEASVALRFQRACEVNRHFGPNGCPEPVWRERERLYKKLRSLK